MVTSFLNRFAPIDFDRYIDRLTDRFTGREWLFEQHIDPWLQQGKEQFYLLTGEPGVGKSAIVAQLVKRWKAQSQDLEQGILAAYHFCRAGDVETVRPGRVLRSIAAQLGETLPHYGKALNKVLEQVHLNIDVNININSLTNSQVTGIYIENLKDLDPREELRLLIQAPLAELPTIYQALPEEDREKLPTLKVFLIDSLDEAVTTTGRDNVATLLAAFSQNNDLPPWIRFILTARPNSSVLQNFQSIQKYKLEELFSKNLEDIEQYVCDRVQELITPPKLEFQTRLEQAEISAETLVDEVKTLSEGNFLYTRLVMDGIGAGELSLKNLSALPKNLYEVYQRFLRHRCSVRKWVHLYQPILGTLTVTQEAISTTQLTKFVRIASTHIEGEVQVEGAIAILRQFLDEVEDEQGQKLYTIFHQSLREYLLDRKRNHDFWCDAKEQHNNIIECCEQESQNWQDLRAIDLYGLRHLVQHLVKGDQVDELHQLLSREKDGRNAWFDAKDQASDVEGFVADVRLAWKQAEEEFAKCSSSQSISLQCRYALSIGSVNSLSDNIPSNFLAALIEHQVWTISKGLAYAQQITRSSQRFQCLKVLIPHTPASRKERVVQQALAAAQAIESLSDQIIALKELLPYLPESSAKQAFQRTLAIIQTTGETQGYVGYYCVDLLTELIPHLPETQRESVLQQAVAATKTISEHNNRVTSLTKLLPYLSGTLKEQVLQEVFCLAQLMEPEWEQVVALVKLIPYLPQSRGDQVSQDCIRAITKDTVNLLPSLLPTLSQELREQVLQPALTTAEAIRDDATRAKALAILIPYLSEPLKTEVSHEALVASRMIEDIVDQATFLINLIPVLPKSLTQKISQHVLDMIQIIHSSDTSEFKNTRVWLLTQLISNLPTSLINHWQQVLEKTLAIPSQPDKYRPLRLAPLIPYLSDRLKDKILGCALNEAQYIQDTDGPDRACFLAELAPYLTEELVPHAMKIAQATEGNRKLAVSWLAAHVKLPTSSQQNILKQALITSQAIEDGARQVEMMSRLFAYSSEAFKKENSKQLLDKVLTMPIDWQKLNTLTELIPHLPDSDLSQAFIALQENGKSDLIELIPHLSGVSRQIAYQHALKSVEAIENQEYQAGVLVRLIPYLPATTKQEMLQRALCIAQIVHDPAQRTSLLTQLAPHLVEPFKQQTLEEALNAARAIEDDWQGLQVKALIELIPYLSGNFRDKVLTDTLSKAKLIPSEEERIRSLAKLSSYLPEPLHEQAVQFCVQAVQSHQYRKEFLTEVVSLLSISLQQKVLEAVETIVDRKERLEALIQLIPSLSNALQQQALQVVQRIQPEEYGIQELAELADLLPEQLTKQVLEAALCQIRALHHGKFGGRERLPKLKRLVPRLTTLPIDLLHPLWVDTLHFLVTRDRDNLLSDLGVLTPVIFILGGTEAVEKTFYAVQTTGMQWQ